MLAEFDGKRAEQEVIQQEADRICGRMWAETGEALEAHRESTQEDSGRKLQQTVRRVGRVALSVGVEIFNFRGDPWETKQHPNPDELRSDWVLSKKVDLEGKEPTTITLEAWGGDSPLKSLRKFIHIEGASHKLELREDNGIMWEEEKVNDHTYFRRTNIKAGIDEAEFYRKVLDRFQNTS